MKSIGIFFKPDLEKIASSFAKKLEEKNVNIKFFSSNVLEINYKTDVTLVIGGDGTVLKAAKFVLSPIIGFKGGRLGFLSSYTIEEFGKFLKDFETNQFREDKRQFLEVKEINALCLNDVVALKEPSQKMVDIEITFRDGNFVFHADGLVISTPTGSTAYSLSLGGPILLPNVDAYVLTPIAPQFLASRSVILPDYEEISVLTSFETHLIVDGVDYGKFKKFSVKKSEKNITILRPFDYDFSKSIKEKLGYGKNYFK